MITDTAGGWIVAGLATVVLAALTCAALIVVLQPWLRRYALANPNARSSHNEPTPQGAGIAIVAATTLSAWVALSFFNLDAAIAAPPLAVLGATLMMACVGIVDDIRPIPAAPRMMLQAVAVAIVIHALPDELRVLPSLPWWIERVLLVIGGVWFVNLINFMDGIDWMTVAEVVPLSGALAVIGALGALPAYGIVVSLALGGAIIGFGYFNRPVATLFLGDVGSLSIGLILGWLLVLVAGSGHLIAALLLPLYYLADTTITLVRRLARREPVWQAHRAHFYQSATGRGFRVIDVVARVFALNVALCTLAVLTVIIPGKISNFAALAAGTLLVTWVLISFANGRQVRGKAA
jgi:UDP-N-acetylmuramyl pentapeptide phosphotransferase/UDP-N-acetylglucosamine-1-phosphate transferase